MPMASRALIARLSTASSSWVESAAARPEPRAARERQHLVGQFGPALSARAHVAKPLLHLAVDSRGGDLALEKADVAEHHRQQIVEVMRHARGELADGLEPLHLAQCGLDALALLHL